MKKIIITACSFVLTAVSCYSQAPKYSNEFLSIGVGARALSMSNATVGIVDDVTSGYWNPAGLTMLPSKIQGSLMHAEYFAGIAKYDYGAVAARIDGQSAAALSIIRFGVDDIPNTTELIDAEGNIDYDRITTFSAADYGFLFSYARTSKIPGLRYGASVKIIHRRVGDFARAWGFGLDAGARYDLKNWKFGLVARDITSTFNAWSYSLSPVMLEVFTRTGNEIPSNGLELTLPRLILSGGRSFDFGKKFSGLVVVDADMTFDGMRNVLIKSDPISLDPHVGLEFGYNNIVFLRGGFGNFQQERDQEGVRHWTFQPNIGVGVTIRKIVTIDYALTDIGNASVALYSNIFSLKFNISGKKETNTPPPEKKSDGYF